MVKNTGTHKHTYTHTLSAGAQRSTRNTAENLREPGENTHTHTPVESFYERIWKLSRMEKRQLVSKPLGGCRFATSLYLNSGENHLTGKKTTHI